MWLLNSNVISTGIVRRPWRAEKTFGAAKMKAGDPAWILFALGALALTLAIISGIRLVQRMAGKRYLSASAFALRLAVSLWLLWVFGSVLVVD